MWMPLLGLGGDAMAILRRISPEGKLIGIDRDEKALKLASEVLKGENVKAS